MLKDYIQLTKPGIIFGNLIAVSGGFLLATRGHFELFIFVCTLVGVACVIAGGCVANNLIDRDIDGLMQRTAKRATVTGRVSLWQGLVYALILMSIGLLVLYWHVNLLSALLGLIGLLIYVGLYSLDFKRNSIHGTFIGSFSGAIPPMIGYVAVMQTIDLSALLILAMFCFWQMPHAYAIALNRYKDYEMAGIPVLPHVRGIKTTKQHALIYCLLFYVASLALGFVGSHRVFYSVSALILGGYWCFIAFQLLKAPSLSVSSLSPEGSPLSEKERRISKKLFLFSIILITCLSIAMAIPF